MPTALVTGASRGLGHATAHALAVHGWNLVVDARDASALRAAVAAIRADIAVPADVEVVAVPGDVTDPDHRAALADAVARLAPAGTSGAPAEAGAAERPGDGGASGIPAAPAVGHLDALVHNASALGPSPLPHLLDLDPDDLAAVLATNVVAPLALTQELAAPLRAARGVVVHVTSDAAVEAYPGWGGYGASKAALEHLARVLAVEEPDLRVHAFDPGDLRTAMHQAAFPGEDISDRPEPHTVVPALLHLLQARPPSGRYRASDLLAGAPETVAPVTVAPAAVAPAAVTPAVDTVAAGGAR